MDEVSTKPWTVVVPTIVEDAWDIKPDVNVPSPVTERVEPSWAVPEAVNELAALREPEVKREEEIVEEAWEKRPDWAVKSPPIVPVEVAESRPEIPRSFEMKVNPLMVEEAEEKKPPVRVERPEEMVRPEFPVINPPNVPVEEAVKVLAVLSEPEVKRELAKVEEAEEKRLPFTVM